MFLYWSNWFVLFPLAVSMYVAMRLSLGSQDSYRRSLLGTVVRVAMVMLMWFSFLAVGFRGWIGAVWLAAILVLGFVLFCKRRRLERNVMLYCALDVLQPTEQRSLMQCFSDEPIGQLPRLARGVLSDLDKGMAWGEALERWNVGRGTYEVLSLRLLDRYGSQEVSLETTAEMTPIQVESEVERLLARFSVFFWVLLAAPIFGLIATFIIPTFREMFQEFDIEVPWALNLLSGQGTPVLSIVLALLGLLILAVGAVAVVTWMFPSMLTVWPLRILCRDYFRSVGLSALGMVARRESDLKTLFETTSEVVPVDFIAKRYNRAAQKIQQGQPISDALTQSGIVSRRELGDLIGQLSGPDAIWALRQYAGWRVQRMLGRYSLLIQALIVGLTLVLAVCIGTIAYGVFSALTHMTTSLGQPW
ncbi:MAG: hypothetical protein Aurels2KO_41150 [Aureliella sp.]